jgi:hypothetical protein
MLAQAVWCGILRAMNFACKLLETGHTKLAWPSHVSCFKNNDPTAVLTNLTWQSPPLVRDLVRYMPSYMQVVWCGILRAMSFACKLLETRHTKLARPSHVSCFNNNDHCRSAVLTSLTWQSPPLVRSLVPYSSTYQHSTVTLVNILLALLGTSKHFSSLLSTHQLLSTP